MLRKAVSHLRSIAAQHVNDGLLSAKSPRARRLLANLRRAMIHASDPIITIVLDGVRLEAPLSHETPFYRRDYPRYSKNAGTIAAIVGGPILDVGANIGDTVALFRAAGCDAPVLCIEGDEAYATLLRRNIGRLGDVEVAVALVGDARSTVHGRLEASAGTAGFMAGDTTMDVITLDELLAAHPRFGSPALLKVDTDGFDARVVEGASATIGACHPVLFVEFYRELLARCDSDAGAFLTLMSGLGYGPVVVYDNFGTPVANTTLDDVLWRTDGVYLDLAVFPIGDNRADELWRIETSPRA